MTRRVTGGRVDVDIIVEDVVFVCDDDDGFFCDKVSLCCLGYRYGAAAQSSSKKGSSSPSDFSRGSLVARRARCVVRERRGRG